MATGEAQEKTEEAGKAKGGSRKLIIIIVLITLLAIGAAAGVTWYLLGSSPADESVAEAPGPEVPVKGPAEYYKFRQPIIVTFNVGNRQRFLQVHISLLIRQAGVYDGLELHLPVIQNRLLNVFADKDFMAIQTNEGRIAIQEEAREVINAVLSEQKIEGEIEKVLFTNLVMQ
jgi:flagellar protein FliL